jgi:hypothetical protein
MFISINNPSQDGIAYYLQSTKTKLLSKELISPSGAMLIIT